LSPRPPSLRSVARPRAGRRLVAGAIVALAVALLGDPGLAWASDKAAAESLFNAGKSLMDEERYAEACEKFAGSMDAEPSVGAQLNLALCNEKQGKIATAWSLYRDAAVMAGALNDSRRQRGAEALAAELEPRVSKLTIHVSQAIDGLRVTNDGALIGSYDEALPIDPGKHRIVASAPGRRTWTKTISVSEAAKKEEITVPVLEPFPDASPSEAGGEEPLPTWQRITGWSAVGVGALGVTIGTVFGILATSDANALQSACGEDKTCPDDQLDDLDAARTKANVATGTLVVGGLLAAGGVVLLLLDPIPLGGADDAAQLLPSVGPTGASLTLSGRF